MIQNYAFVGYANAVTTVASMQAINLADFYNPNADDTSPKTGDDDDRYFPADSQYGAGQLKPKALLIDVSSVWCPPCNDEAHYTLPAKYATYKPMGGEFLLNLADGPVPGTSATPKNLQDWTTKYVENFPAAIDPEYKLAALFAADYFPANMMVNTRNMKICKVMTGAPDDAAWAEFGNIISGKESCE